MSHLEWHLDQCRPREQQARQQLDVFLVHTKTRELANGLVYSPVDFDGGLGWGQ